MKFLKFISIVIIFFVLGYIIGNLFPTGFLSVFKSFGSISGDTELRITVLKKDKTPVENLEVDIGPKPGPPPEGGAAITDESGTATFYLKSGKYFIYFNAGNFPKDLEYPHPKQIEVEEDKINEYTIILRERGK